ncbi:15987_t:CDS:1, partial [Dentiscutata heterogama]
VTFFGYDQSKTLKRTNPGLSNNKERRCNKIYIENLFVTYLLSWRIPKVYRCVLAYKLIIRTDTFTTEGSSEDNVKNK